MHVRHELNIKHSFILQSDSPSESDLNALGIYLIVSLCFVVGALVEFAFAILLTRIISTRTKDKPGGIKTEQDERTYNGVQNYVRQSWSAEEIITRRKVDTTPHNDNVSMKPPNRPWMLFLWSVNGFDFAAFWVYLLLYLLFNCVYWAKYLIE